MRALLVGAGGMGKAWARNLLSREDVELAGWVDLRPGAASDAAQEFGLPAIHTGQDLHEALTAVVPDFVVDVTAPAGHHPVTMAALSYGVPVIGEKPMAESMEQAKEMVAASEDSGKLYMVSQSRRYNGKLSAFRHLIEKIGGAGILHADFMLGPHFGGFRDEMDNVLLLDMAIHTFDEARFLTGADPVSVYAEEYNPAWSWYQGNASANALFEMTGGLRFCYRGSWCSEGLSTSWDADWRAVGPKGTSTWTADGTPAAEVVTGTEGFFRATERVEEPEHAVKGGISGSLDEFLAALATGKRPQGECHDNIKSLAMVFAAVESARRGERVYIEEILSA